MKYLAITFLLCFVSFTSFSQNTYFNTKYNALLENLEAENWVKAEKACKELLKYVEPIDSMQTEKMVLRYIYIYTNAGLLNAKKITQKEALKRTEYLQGKDMILPSHPFNSDCYVNCTHISDDDKNTFFSGVNDSKGTQIFSFEYVKIEDGIKETKEELEGKWITLKGTLNEISVEGMMFPRFKLKFINGTYKIGQQ
ncbi:hypothetical protein [Ferruginibacter albus]|uniref:hypothetical protein n=1 Tax=Ferruginibacter albus TaxID=2875540 RepID=UPI001CC708A4|nr:hypothetical protein [Ferruginibacter albus]UAY52675.1 hypothetical protein K9M53_03030 [Ferruginibacter albus]